MFQNIRQLIWNYNLLRTINPLLSDVRHPYLILIQKSYIISILSFIQSNSHCYLSPKIKHLNTENINLEGLKRVRNLNLHCLTRTRICQLLLGLSFHVYDYSFYLKCSSVFYHLLLRLIQFLFP